MDEQALISALLPSPISSLPSSSIEANLHAVKEESQDKKYVASKQTKKNFSEPNKSADFVSSILDQDNDNVIDFFDNVDPMLAWALLKSKILPQVGTFDLLAERAKLQHDSSDPLLVVKTFLQELDTLLQDVFQMLQSCCYQSSTELNENTLTLNQGMSLQFFGTNSVSVCVKTLTDFPNNYKEKMFKPQEMKPLHLVKAEIGLSAPEQNEPGAASDVLNELDFNEDFDPDEDDENHEELEEEEDDEDNDEDFKVVKKSEKNDKKNPTGSSSKKKSPMTCEKCHKTYNTQTQFRIHQRDEWRCPGKPEPKWLRIVKGKDYYCLHPDCSTDGVNGPLFPRRNKYWHHLREKHWNRETFAFDCTYCQEKFPFYDMLRQHIKQYHEKAHVCKYCGSSFSRRRDLTLHERRHTGEKPYACDKCDFRCNTAGSLRMHTVRRHEDPNLHRTHVCEICGKSFHAAYILKEHILTHSDIKRYTCDICGRQLRNDSCYRRHMMNIHGQKISCDHCNKDFSSPIGVKIHKRDAHGIMY